MKRIAILAPGDLPIPARMGGAIETLVSHLIEENEQRGMFTFHVFNTSKYAKTLAHCRLLHTELRSVACHQAADRAADRAYQLWNKATGYREPYQSVYLQKVCRILRQERFDEVLIEGLPRFAWRIWKDCRIKPILHVHTDILDQNTRNCGEILASCKQVLCVSQYIANRVSSIPNREATAVNVFRNCVDTRRFNAQTREKFRDETRKEFGFLDSDFVFMYTGRLHPQKGIRELLAAFEQCKVPNKRMALVGGARFGDSGTDAFVNELERYASKHPHEVRLTGYVPHDGIARILSAADAYVSPSLFFEAAPLGILEAICAQIPCIVSNRGGIPEYVAGTDSILVDMDQNAAQSIARAMEEIHARSPLPKNGTDACKRDHLSTAAYYERFLALLQR